MNTTIAGAIIADVIKLVNHTTDLVRKKAVLALQRIVLRILYRNKSKVGRFLSIRRK